jgi:hypothetical protein
MRAFSVEDQVFLLIDQSNQFTRLDIQFYIGLNAIYFQTFLRL